MIFIPNSSTDPYFNLALEEYLLKIANIPDEIVLLWQNDNTIVIGKHQNALEEINTAYVEANHIHVSRRITGGGAVYHDLGNLNFSFITGVERYDQVEIKKYAQPIAKALAQIGVKAEISGRNDITIDGKKISGTAQALHRKRLLYHSTLLFDSDLSKLGQALNVQSDKIQSKGIKSVRSRVTNIRGYLPHPEMTIQDFEAALLQSLFDEQPYREYRLSDADLAQVTTLEKEKFSTWSWIYGESPPYNYKNSKRFAGGQVEVQLNVVKGLIQGCKFYGDFLGLESVEAVEKALTGRRYARAEIEAALGDLPLERYFGAISQEELLSCLFE